MSELVALEPNDEAAFDRWAKKRRFVEGWLYEVARSHAQYWRAEPLSLGRWFMASAASAHDEEPLRGFEPGFESESAFRRRIQSHIRARRIATPNDDHLRWLALYQVKGLSQTKIAENVAGNDAVSTHTVSEALKSAAALLGVRLRPGRRGPQRKLRKK
jgi:hypothetical protein